MQSEPVMFERARDVAVIDAILPVVELIRERNPMWLAVMRARAREVNRIIEYRDGNRTIATVHPNGVIDFPR